MSSDTITRSMPIARCPEVKFRAQFQHYVPHCFLGVVENLRSTGTRQDSGEMPTQEKPLRRP